MTQEVENKDILYRIRKLRRAGHLTQKYLADKMNISVRAYSKIESGETQLTINRLNEIANILNISSFELIGVTYPMDRQGDRTLNALQSSDKIIENYQEIIKSLKAQNKMLLEIIEGYQANG